MRFRSCDVLRSGLLQQIPGRHFVRNLVERRTLLWELVRRDFELRYKGSVAGWLWGVIHPLVLLASYTFVFSICLRQKPGPGEVTQNFPLFLFAGMLPWLLFSETVQRSATSMLDQANLITKTVFPAEVVPIAIFLSSLVSHALAVVLALAGAMIFLHQITPAVFLLPAVLVILGLFSVGLAWVAAGLQVYLRDTAQVISVIFTLWFWVTPIFLSEQRFPQQVRFLLILNPLAPVVRAYRNMLLGGPWPNLQGLAVAGLWALAAFIAGGLFFRQMKRGFADVL